MAPELRKRTRSATASAEKPAAKKTAKVEKVEKVEPEKVTKKKTTKVEKVEKAEKAEKVEKIEKLEKAPKRKAPEEAQASPVAAKKQKPVKASAKSKKSKPEPVEEAEPETTEAAEESVVALDDAADSDEEVDADIQALAAGLDSDAEKTPAGNGTFKEGMDVGKVPKHAKKQKQLTNGKKEEPGIVFISRLPHGFYEHELKGYFSQFGPINRLRLARNKKTGASKHYAFLEFAEESTAEIVSKTMDSYLLFGHILKVKTVPRDQLHEDVWKGANKRFKKIPWSKIAAGEVAKPRTESNWTHKVSREEKKRLERAQKLKEIGYEFEAPKLKEAVAPPPEPMVVDAPEEPKAVEAAPVEEKPVEEAAAEEEESAEAEKPKAAKPKAKKGGRRKSKA
ncbi:Putative RNA recognition motif domain, nucleotide-binding alpha-beta plait domain superfamily [Colletotrichum destructivum]|uniref:RNA recognition motif domain, nucleotide-binding alpha-beta plait domain superfamily n=1 Tax=Colletotrichum destructivum TaxID=34406 RepID=A0AAX4IEP4_9PEZI|nr:Putative RNA recognition motif domain, nucleotide-binding alpha-beta plait domain superfamily [Colletotrichum destructivum]